MVALISTLPEELLLYLLEMALLAVRGSPPDLISMLITLTSIDSSWRDLVIGYAPFWTHIHTKLKQPPVVEPRLLGRVFPSDFARVRTFLERSKESALQLEITRTWSFWHALSDEEVADINRDWKLMYEVLEPHMHRCSSICFDFHGTQAFTSTDLPDLLQSSDFPLLRQLSIRNYYAHSPWSEGGAWGDDWRITPQHTPLQALSFNDPTFERYIPEALNAPWPGLSSLTLHAHRSYWRNVCDTLAQLPSLQTLSLELVGGLRAPSVIPSKERQKRVLLPVLHDISTNNLMIWHDICTPDVKSATITYLGPYEPLEGLLVEQSGPVIYPSGEDRNSTKVAQLLALLAELPLREITFIGGSLYSRAIPLVLGVLSHVQTLRLPGGYGHESVLRTLLRKREIQSAESLEEGIPMLFVEMQAQMVLPELKLVTFEQSVHDWSATEEKIRALESLVNRLRAVSLSVKWTLHGRNK
ncbi:hypothetical protein DL93DRAFT_2201134 [Clavulina sp. PMI_390]|nr:hypothetical protein DL93DRAFT_2201134 [Clavulina sp. PMI_390]